MSSLELSHSIHTNESTMEAKSARRSFVRSEFHRAHRRFAFLDAVQSYAPRVIKDLVVRGGRVPKYEQFGEVPASVLASIEAWCRRWNLVGDDGCGAEWVVKMAANELAYRRDHKADEKEWACPSFEFGQNAPYTADLKEVGILPPELILFKVPAYRWTGDLTGRLIAEDRAWILSDFEKRLDAHIAKLTEWAQGSGLRSVPEERRLKTHMEWFVRFQVEAEPYEKITSEVGVKALRKAMIPIADSLDIRLRRLSRPKF